MVEPVLLRPSQRDQMREERLEVLRLLEAGDITVEETATLLEALDRAVPTTPASEPAAARSASAELRLVRIRITDSGSGKSMVNVAFPLGLIKTGLDIASQYGAEVLPGVAEIRETINAGFRGSLVDVDDGGQRVEIIAE
jgi:hypothetical protein